MADLAQHAACEAARIKADEYAERWPQFCRRCGATGLVDDSDPSVGDYGSSPCELCATLGKCPRCAAQIADTSVKEYEAMCEASHPDADVPTYVGPVICSCGWRADLPETWYPVWECYCHIDAPDDIDDLLASLQ